MEPGMGVGADIHWQEPVNGGDVTTREARFAFGGREYKVTVAYKHQAVMDCYSIGGEGVHGKIEEMISEIGAEQLKQLAGYSIRAPLSNDAGSQPRIKRIGGEGDYQPVSLDEDAEEGEAFAALFPALRTIQGIFWRHLPREVEEPEVEVVVEEVNVQERYPWLSGTNPVVVRQDREIEDAIDNANRAVEEGLSPEQVGASWDSKKRSIVHLLRGEVAEKQHQHEILRMLVNKDFANEVRVALGLQNAADVISETSQGQIEIEGRLEGVGRNACASICGDAILHLNDYRSITKEEEVVDILTRGVERHIADTELEVIPEPKNFADGVMVGLNESLDGQTFTREDIAERDRIFELEDEQYVVFTAKPNGDEGDPAESILLYKEGDSFCVFDSHARTIEEVSRGASVRKFESQEGLKAYIEEQFSREAYDWSADRVSVSAIERDDEAEG